MLRAMRGISISIRLPFWLSLLMLVVIATLAGIAYREVRRGALAAARTRLETVTTQLATSNVDVYRRRIVSFTGIAQDPDIVRFTATPGNRVPPPVQQQLQAASADTAQVLSTAIVAADGRVLAAAGDTARARVFGPPPLHDDSTLTGPLVLHDSSLGYATTSPIRNAGSRIGYLVQWRKVQTSARQRETITQFIGSNASVYFGSADGLWVDLAGVRATPPPPAVVAAHYGEFDRPGHGRQLAAVQPMAGTPWLLEVDFARDAILADLRGFMRRLAVASFFLLVIGAVLGWLASRRIIQPLFTLTNAADAMAAGDYSHRMHSENGDEIGRLSRAVDQMAERVQASQEELEGRVAQRTRELSRAMSDLQEAQDSLVRKERLALLGQLSSSVGHELRNPLGVMSNAVYYLDTVLTDIPPTAREYLGILREQIAVSSKIVTDLMDFTRIRKPERQVVPLAPLIADQAAACPPGVSVKRELAPDVPDVLADPVHVGQILRNLVSNACQAMDGPGTLTLRATPGEPGTVRIEVNDTGPGIAPENLQKVFEPLFTTRARGIGLGLAVARTLAEANGGSLSVASTPGAGATFTLTLQAPTPA